MIFSILDMLVASWRIITILCFSISQNQYLMVLFKLGKVTLLGKICSKFVFNLHIILQIWKSQHFLKSSHSLIDSSSIPLKVFFFSPKCFVQVRERHGLLWAVTEFRRIWRKYLFEFCSDEFSRNPWKYTGYPQL